MPSASRVLRCGRVGKILHGAFVTGFALLGPASLGWNEAQARPDYNDEVFRLIDAATQASGGLPCTSPHACVICHENPAGGGSFGKPFSTALLGAGFEPNPGDIAAAVETIEPALEALRTGGTDQSEDGVSDWDQLAQLSDPNEALDAAAVGSAGAGSAGAGSAGASSAGASSAAGGPQAVSSGGLKCDGARYGCGAHIAPPAETSPLPLLGVAAALLGILGFAARRRR